jgi:hypothetical protein
MDLFLPLLLFHFGQVFNAYLLKGFCPAFLMRYYLFVPFLDCYVLVNAEREHKGIWPCNKLFNSYQAHFLVVSLSE